MKTTSVKVQEQKTGLALSEPKSIAALAVTGAAWMVAFRMFSRGIGIISTLILARLLDASDFGIVAVAFTISAALSSVSNVGITENLIREKTLSRAELDTGFTIQLIKGGITGLLLLATAPLAATWFSEPRLTNVIYVLAAVFALGGLENISIVKFRRDMRFDREFRLSAVERVSAFIATLIAAVVLRSYWALIVGMTTAKIARVVSSYIMEPYSPRIGLHAWKKLASFSLWMWFSSLAYVIWLRADPLVVGSQVSKTMLGLYVIALDIALLPATEVIEPIGTVLFASFAAEHNAGRDTRGKTFLLAISLITIMLPIALVLSAASTDVVFVLLGSKWSAAAPIVAILAFSVVLSPLSNLASQSLTASGKLRANLFVVLFASLVKIIVLLLAARTQNLDVIARSALVITSVESILFIVALYYNGSRFDGLGWPIIRIAIAACVTAFTLWATGIAWEADNAFSLLTCLWRAAVLGVVGFGVYAIVLSGLWALSGYSDGPERQIGLMVLPFMSRVSRQFSTSAACK